jgi:flagellar protein FliO/FliZ
MDTYLLLKFVAAFVFVISLMFALAWALKKSGVAGAVMTAPSRRRLRIVEFIQIDARRRLVLVRRDDKEHLLVLGHESELVVEAGIPAQDNVVELTAGKDQKNVQG